MVKQEAGSRKQEAGSRKEAPCRDYCIVAEQKVNVDGKVVGRDDPPERKARGDSCCLERDGLVGSAFGFALSKVYWRQRHGNGTAECLRRWYGARKLVKRLERERPAAQRKGAESRSVAERLGETECQIWTRRDSQSGREHGGETALNGDSV